MVEEKTVTLKLPKMNPWMLVTLVLVIALVVVLLTGWNLTGMYISTGTNNALTPEQAAENAISWITNYFKSRGSNVNVTLVNASETENGVYQFTVKLSSSQGSTEETYYVSKDGKLFFPQGISTEAILQPTPTTTQPQQPSSIPKSDRPDVKLFVMSYCPYGLQAEKALLPVYNLLKDKADIGIYFVDYCMHGKKEVDENLRQYCIERDQKDKYYDYLSCFIASSGDYAKCLNEANIDKTQLDSCEAETDERFNITGMYNDQSTWASGRFPQFNVEKDLNEKYGVRGSPTIVINDQVVNINRSPESFKEAICSAFNNPPTECQQTLSTESASPGFGNVPGGSSSGGCAG